MGNYFNGYAISPRILVICAQINLLMELTSFDEQMMDRCLQLAAMAQGHTYPNPMVGSVIVHQGKIIGEGYHQKAGEPHAEVNAINSVKDQSLLASSTLYVNLEPCAHFGKTPPCSDLIIEKQIPRVVIGCIDSFSQVAGKGIERMRHAGIEVLAGIREMESRELNRRFFTFHEKKQPYIVLKWAQSMDGFIDFERGPENFGQPNWITNEWARRAVHQRRTLEQAILVGTHTALKDNPSLTIRDWHGNQPLRMVLDQHLSLPSSLKLFDHQHPTWVITAKSKHPQKNLEYKTIDFSQNILSQLLDILYKNEIQSIIVEGGAILLQSFLDQGLWDEINLFTGSCWFQKGVNAPRFKGHLYEKKAFGDSILFVYRNNSLI